MSNKYDRYTIEELQEKVAATKSKIKKTERDLWRVRQEGLNDPASGLNALIVCAAGELKQSFRNNRVNKMSEAISYKKKYPSKEAARIAQLESNYDTNSDDSGYGSWDEFQQGSELGR